MEAKTYPYLKQELLIFLGVVIVSGATGALTGWPLPCLLLGLLGYLGWHLYHLVRLPGLLGSDTTSGLASPAGLWGAVHAKIRYIHESSRNHEHALSQSVNRFRDAVAALPDAVVILNRHGVIEWSNPAAESLLAITPDSSGQVFSQQVTDPVLDEYLAAGNYTQPLVFTAPVNRAIILSLLVTPLDKHRQQLIVASDISRRYHLDKVKRDFVANVSHELRTPLTVISGLLEQMETGDMDSGTLERATELMQQQAHRMRELVSDLLTLSRLESEVASSRSDPVQVPELLTAIVEEARALSGTAGHVLQLHMKSPHGLRGNPKELRTAFSNLITNAIQHTPNRAEIRIDWIVDPDGAHLSVSDTGEGIPARHIPRLTERLYRVDASRSRDTGGTGLGLAIVKHVLDQHDAELEITSEIGRGSTFTCHFPAERVITPDTDKD